MPQPTTPPAGTGDATAELARLRRHALHLGVTEQDAEDVAHDLWLASREAGLPLTAVWIRQRVGDWRKCQRVRRNMAPASRWAMRLRGVTRVADTDREAINAADYRDLLAAIPLTPRDRLMIAAIVEDGCTLEQAAKRVGLTKNGLLFRIAALRPRVARVLARAA